MIDHEREREDAIFKDPPPIDPRYYGQYSDMIDRMDSGWFERVVKDWESDHPVTVPRRRGVSG